MDDSCKTNTKESCPCNENEVVFDGDCIPRSSCQCTDSDGIISNVNINCINIYIYSIMNRLIFMRLYYVYFKFLFKELDHLHISLKIVILC